VPSDIRFPLVATACLKFNAQAYPAIVPPGDIVKTAVHGADPQGIKAARGMRVSAYMSHQLRHDVKNWEDDTDRLLMQLPFAGQMFRKTWPDPATGTVCSRLCKAGSVIVNDAVASLEAAPRISEKLPFYPVEIIERQRAGLFVDGDWARPEDSADSLAPVDLIEQHRRFDLDRDGYPEPYVVTVHEESNKVVRIAANWDADSVRVNDQWRICFTWSAGSASNVEFIDYH
jgi:chaperonin GroES